MVTKLLTRELTKLDTNYTIHSDLNINENSKSDRKSDRSDRGERSRDRGERSDRRDRGDSGSRRDKFSSNESTTRLFINLGKKDNLRYDEMRELIFQHSKVSGHNIKDIDMGGVFSFFETDAKSAERILDNFRDVEINGREVRVDRADGQGGGGGAKSFGGGRTSGGGSRPNRERTASSSSGSFDRRKKTFSSSSKSSDKPATASKPRYKKKDDLSW